PFFSADLAPAFEGLRQRHLVGVLEIAAHREPTGDPRDADSEGGNSFARYSAVASPSTLGLVARITSVVSPPSSRTRSSLTLRSSGPMPSRGERAPSSTW